MTLSSHQIDVRIVRYFHEVLFSLSTAFLAVSLIFLAAPPLSIPFAHLEVSINGWLHIRQTDLIRGYLEYSIATAILAFGIAVLLHTSSSTRVTKEILRSVTGFVVLLAPPTFWFCYYQVVGWPFRWPYRWAPVELTIAVFCASLYLLGRLPIPGWLGIFLLAAHYDFWYWIPSSNPNRADYAGPIGPILGLCSALAWGVYVSRSRSHPNRN